MSCRGAAELWELRCHWGKEVQDMHEVLVQILRCLTGVEVVQRNCSCRGAEVLQKWRC
jgi:hypothetical protein